MHEFPFLIFITIRALKTSKNYRPTKKGGAGLFLKTEDGIAAKDLKEHKENDLEQDENRKQKVEIKMLCHLARHPRIQPVPTSVFSVSVVIIALFLHAKTETTEFTDHTEKGSRGENKG